MKKINRTASPITIVIIEDHTIVSDALVKLFEIEGGFHTMEVAKTVKQGIEAILTHQPQIAILDMHLPDGEGLQVAEQIKHKQCGTTAIILLTQAERDIVVQAFEAGASAYCHKSISADELIQVIRKVHEGYYYIEGCFMRRDDVSRWVNKQLNNLFSPYIKQAHIKNVILSPRERDILKSVVQGKSNKEISLHLHISQQTVKNHMTSILNKLDVRDRTQAVITAIRQGWVNINDEFIDL
jgi:two-component system response regulator DegU